MKFKQGNKMRQAKQENMRNKSYRKKIIEEIYHRMNKNCTACSVVQNVKIKISKYKKFIDII